MSEKAFFLKLWEREAPATRRVLERVPEKSDYRPDPKARTAREIAWVMVLEETFIVNGLETGRFEWRESPTPGTVRQILEIYDGQHEDLTSRLRRLDEAAWQREAPFVVLGNEVRDNAYGHASRIFLDQIHHRGQLSTYLRPMGCKVPSIIGPSADELERP